MSDPERELKFGNEHPYDHGQRDADVVLHSDDWSYRAARGVLSDLLDRKGIKWELQKVDIPTRVEIVQSMAAIIKLAAAEGK